jgi:hypothetical protein
MPVPAGSKFGIKIAPSNGTPIVRAYWMPIEAGGSKMGAREHRSINTKHTTSTDGILHGYTYCDQTGESGTLKLYSSDRSLTDQPLAVASVYYFPSHEGIANSAMLPIRQEATYIAVLEGNSKASVFWTPLVP